MILFSSEVFSILIYGSLILTGLGFLTLLLLLWRDARSRSIW